MKTHDGQCRIENIKSLKLWENGKKSKTFQRHNNNRNNTKIAKIEELQLKISEVIIA